MATLDPAALERELEALRRQRFEASQRVRASRQPPAGPTSQARNTAGETSGARAVPGSGRFGQDRGVAGPPPARGEDRPRAAGFREGPFSGRLGPSAGQARGSFGSGPEGPQRGRFEGGPGHFSRDGGAAPFSARGHRGQHGDYGRDRDRDRDWAAGGNGVATQGAPPPARRRAVQSLVVREGEPQQRDAEGDAEEERDRDRDRDWEGGDARRGREREREGERGWGRGGEEGRYNDNDDTGREGPGRGLKRPAPSPASGPAVGASGAPGGAAAAPVSVGAEDVDSRKRARRLLGRALLGTLQKFRQEDAQFQASEAAARRAELARKAEEKAAAESERLRRQAAEERSKRRQEELRELLDLNLATDIKMLELLFAKKLSRRRALGAFLRADGASSSGAGDKPGGPTSTTGAKGSAVAAARPMGQSLPVYWLPVRHCEATLAIKERQERELRDWEEAVLAELGLEKEQLRQRAEVRRAGMAERRQRAAEARAAGQAGAGAGAGDAGEEEAEEDHEALEAVELDAHHLEEHEEPNGADADAEAEHDMAQGEDGVVGDESPSGRDTKADGKPGAAEEEMVDTRADGDAAVEAGAGTLDDSMEANADEVSP